MAGNLLDALQVGGDADSVSVSTSDGELAIPPLASGTKPKWVRVSCSGAIDVFVMPGLTGTALVAGEGLHIRQTTAEILHVAGNTHIIHIASGAGTLYVTPLANQ